MFFPSITRCPFLCPIVTNSLRSRSIVSKCVEVLECDARGELTKISKNLSDLTYLKTWTNLPIRDMRIFFQPTHDTLQTFKQPLPVILSRPSSQCFILSLEHLKLLCLKNKCIILNPNDPAVQAFAVELKNKIQNTEHSLNNQSTSMHSFVRVLSEKNEVKFEVAVLESSLSAVVNRFKRHLHLLEPVMNLLLRETSGNPSASMLRRMLAYKKSLGAFEMSVIQTRSSIKEVLDNDLDLQGLCLNSNDYEEMELLLEAYNFDLREIECELLEMKEQIEDTEDFIKIHLNSMRNKIIKMALFMEMGTLSVGFGALGAGLFGMNLTTGLENHPTAFFMAAGGIGLAVGTLFTSFGVRYFNLSRDYSSAKSYQAMRHFFDYVKDIENALHVNKDGILDRSEFRRILEPVVGGQLTDKEIGEIFRILDGNRDGFVDKRELTSITERRKESR